MLTENNSEKIIYILQHVTDVSWVRKAAEGYQLVCETLNITDTRQIFICISCNSINICQSLNSKHLFQH
jgi:hypothetical protein